MVKKSEQIVKTRKKRRVSRFTTMWILLGAIAVLIIATLLMRGAYQRASAPPTTPPSATEQKSSDNALFSVKEVTVSGNTRYLSEAIVQESGLYEGESVWSVDKAAAEQRVLDAFPYIEQVKVTNTAYNRLDIAVTETEEIGVMYAAGQWVMVGANGKVLTTQPLDSDRPLRALYFKGATVNSATPGERAMDERSYAIVTELLAAFRQYELTGVREIDLSNKSDITLDWNGRVTVRLGNDSNLTHEVGVAVSALSGVEQQYGANAAGVLNISAFSEGNAAPRAVFTPKDLMQTTTAPSGSTTAETTADGTNGTSAAR